MNNVSVKLEGGGYISVSNPHACNFGTGDFTLETWVRGQSAGTLIGHKGTEGGGGNGGFLLVVKNDGRIKLATDNGFGFYEIVTDPCEVINGMWHHVAATRKQGLLTIYLDGEKVNATVGSNAHTPLDVNNNLRLTIGTVDQSQEPFRSFTGLIAEVRIWNVARTAEQIEENQNLRLSISEDNLVGYWPFEFGKVVDYTDTMNTASLNGSTSFSTITPSIKDTPAKPMLLLFGGTYSTNLKYGGATGHWQEPGRLYMSRTGAVIYNDQLIRKAKIVGNTVAWNATDGNSSSAEITFMLNGSETYYWPEGVQSNYVFQGWLQSGADGKVDFRGTINNELGVCAFVQNMANGLLLDAGNGTVGSLITLQSMVKGNHQHFCFSSGGNIYHMKSGLVVAVKDGVAINGQTLVLEEFVPGKRAQLWQPETNGNLKSLLDESYFISIAGNVPNSNVVIKTLNGSVADQCWYSLLAAQYITNTDTNTVLSIAQDNSTLSAEQQKLVNTENQMWFLTGSHIVSADSGFAVAIKDGVEKLGAALVLLQMNANDTTQNWNVTASKISTPSGNFAVGVVAGKLVLVNPSDATAKQGWSLKQSNPSLNKVSANKIEKIVSAANTVTYRIEINTSSWPFSGTDDRVEISLHGSFGNTPLITLSHSLTHDDPFERGNTDVFEVTTNYVGALKEIYIRYGENTWFGGESWTPTYFRVYDPLTFTTYDTGYPMLINGVMQYKSVFSFLYEVLTGGSNPMYINQYPATFLGRIWQGYMDHTYLVVEDETVGKTYFNAAGGNTPPAGYSQQEKTLQTRVSLPNAIKMATSFVPDETHTWKPVYGKDDVTGKETCGIVASGRKNWDGQCHQIVNRLLYIGNPSVDLSQANPKPLGYGISCILFGPYGVSFSKWCRENNFRAPAIDTDSAIYSYISRIFGNNTEAHKVFYYATTMKAAWTDDDLGKPDGSTIKTFIQAIHNDGINTDQIAELVNWPPQIVHDEL